MEDRYLFKAKRVDNGWVQGYFMKRHGIPYIFETKECPQSNYEVDESTLCQCTGLKDKNGKLIWENDIISTQYGKAIAIWGKAEWRVKWIEDVIWRRDLHFWANENNYKCEVIGNKFDNPEVLESEE